MGKQGADSCFQNTVGKIMASGPCTNEDRRFPSIGLAERLWAVGKPGELPASTHSVSIMEGSDFGGRDNALCFQARVLLGEAHLQNLNFVANMLKFCPKGQQTPHFSLHLINAIL